MGVRSWRFVALGVVCGASVLLAAPAETGQVQGAAEVAAKGMEAVRAADWAGFTKLMHPEALAAAKKMFEPIVVADTTAEMRRAFFGVETVEQFTALSDAQAFEALMANLTKNIPGFAEALTGARFETIGVLPEGSELAHVVYRGDVQAEGIAVSKTAVVTLRRHGGEWRMLLSGNIEGLAARLAQMAAAAAKSPAP